MRKDRKAQEKRLSVMKSHNIDNRKPRGLFVCEACSFCDLASPPERLALVVAASAIC
jgi:hypothetical protein